MHRVEDARDVLAVAVQDFRVGVGGCAREQRPRHLDMPLAQSHHRIVYRLLPLGLSDQGEERIGHSPRCREDDGGTRPLFAFDDIGDPLHAGGIGDARAAELVYAPALHYVLLCIDKGRSLCGTAFGGWSGADQQRVRRRAEREDGLPRETIDDVDQLGEAFCVFVRTLRDAVRDTLFDVKLEDDMADAPDRRFCRRKLLQNGDAETRLLDHLPDASELSLDALQSREDVALMLDVQRGRRARRARGWVDYSMRIHSASCDLFFGHLMRFTA
jgi:hypothetical protein